MHIADKSPRLRQWIKSPVFSAIAEMVASIWHAQRALVSFYIFGRSEGQDGGTGFSRLKPVDVRLSAAPGPAAADLLLFNERDKDLITAEPKRPHPNRARRMSDHCEKQELPIEPKHAQVPSNP
jgi:hypothetical protein